MSNWSIDFLRTLIFLSFFSCIGQRHEAGIVLENDLYTSSVNDKYYTNGIELYFRFLSDKASDRIAKSTHEIHIGQYIYNPQTVDAADPNYHDRPFAGLLSGKYLHSKFYKSGSYLKFGGSLGWIGRGSGAEAMQEFMHKTFNYKPVAGWRYQIRNTPVLQADIRYYQHLIDSPFADFGLQGQITGGTAFTGATISAVSRIGILKLKPRYESMLDGAAVSSQPSEQKELFIYLSPGFQHQLYDATIQGSPFSDESPVTWPLVPARLVGEAGIQYRAKKICLSYAFVYQGKEADNWVNTGYYYGSIRASYLF